MTELQALVVDLISGDDARAEQAALRLPSFGAQGLQSLRLLLKSPAADYRWWAMRALAGFSQEPGITNDLLAGLLDECEDVRQAAALAFCHQPDLLAMPALIQALSDKDAMTAKLASNALILLGNQATLPLLDVLKNGLASARLEAIRALAEIQDPRAVPALIKAVETDSALMQYWAQLGLDKLGVGMVYLKPE